MHNTFIIVYDNPICGIDELNHQPYYPDFSLCNFDMNPKIKEALGGIRFRIFQASDYFKGQ